MGSAQNADDEDEDGGQDEDIDGEGGDERVGREAPRTKLVGEWGTHDLVGHHTREGGAHCNDEVSRVRGGTQPTYIVGAQATCHWHHRIGRVEPLAVDRVDRLLRHTRPLRQTAEGGAVEEG